jgi:hypothetical protein
MDELLVEKEEIRGRIAGYRAQLETPEHRDDEHLSLQLKIARLELEINGYAIKLEKAEADGDGVREERYSGLIQSRTIVLVSAQQQQERTRQHSPQQGD